MTESLPFSANIMNIKKFVLKSANVKHTRTIKNYEVDYYISGSRLMTINGDHFAVNNGTIVFRKPGDLATSVGDYNCYCLTLDFSHKKSFLCGEYERDRADDYMQEISSNHLLELIPHHFVVRNNAEYIKIFDKLNYNYHNIHGKETSAFLLNQLFFLMLSDIFSYKRNEKPDEKHILYSTCKYVQENFSNPITVKQLAENVSLSQSYFMKIFKKMSNTTPAEYIISFRLSNAKQLLLETNLTIAQIAEQCGFNDASYFSYYFKKKFDTTPNEYRKGFRK